MAAAFLASAGDLPPQSLEARLLVGELSLEGRLQPVRGVLPIVLAARRREVPEVIVPAANAREASVVSGVRVVAAATLGQVVHYLRSPATPPRSTTHSGGCTGRSTWPTSSARNRPGGRSRSRPRAATTCC
jgi:magnesium chelatase family protein